MTLFRKTFFLLLALTLLAGCKHKKKTSLSGNDPVDVSDFIALFRNYTVPFHYGDADLQDKKKETDSLLLSYKVFTRFIPDSVLSKAYGKDVKPKIYALGKIRVPKGETYLLAKTIAAGKRILFILAFDNRDKYVNSLPALRPDQNTNTRQAVSMDRKYIITKTIFLKNANGSVSEGRTVYALNADARDFLLIMTDALEDKPAEMINPIDTLPRKYKYAADYTVNKMNLVSIRDAKRSDRINFFIRFDKDNGTCTGELKGEAIIRGNNTAEYNKDGDPCKLKFIFTSYSVTLKEIEGCGSYRPLNCSLNGTFPRKKEIKPKQATVKKKVVK
jgi:hypothetical protein